MKWHIPIRYSPLSIYFTPINSGGGRGPMCNDSGVARICQRGPKKVGGGGRPPNVLIERKNLQVT